MKQEIVRRYAHNPILTKDEIPYAVETVHNAAVVKHAGAGVTVCAVVKADAYGHGAVECSRALEAEGAQWLGVTSLDEAIPLREAGIQAVLFSGVNANVFALAKEQGLTLPLAAATKKQFDKMVVEGLGGLDKSGIAELTFKGRHLHK